MHIGLRHAYIHQLIRDRVITTDYVQTSENLIDLLRKDLAKDLVLRALRGMRLKPIFLTTNNEALT